MFVTVDGSNGFGMEKIRVRVDNALQLEMVDASAYDAQAGSIAIPVEAESSVITDKDEKRMVEIEERFDILNEMACIRFIC